MHTVNVLREAKESRPDFTVLVGFKDQILPAPPDSEEGIEATLEAAGLLPVQGEV
ncbi:MAG: hypothetical protein AVDCRST_MAG78-1556 [uncultured Rubrobacteraceae bacterium]|uniref:Uncharacterized protein n=1 Tax=uncultured Rubrobacteraceae bacterium TaxID=349277 RepID=A0A6J4Q0Q3_9ACTN|nr:MAG: hypothetical protein AVDCRST_MAG78-1556 [uncultured Rubrobacteraceae bacterium]